MISVIKAVEWLAPKHCENFPVQDKKSQRSEAQGRLIQEVSDIYGQASGW